MDSEDDWVEVDLEPSAVGYRVLLDLDAEDAQRLDTILAREGGTTAQALRRALRAYAYPASTAGHELATQLRRSLAGEGASAARHRAAAPRRSRPRNAS